MRLVVDARSLLPVQPGLGPTGVGRWTAGVVRGLAQAAPGWDIELVLIHRQGSIDAAAFGQNVSFRRVDFSERWQRRMSVFGLWPRIDRLVGRPDAMLGPGFVTWRSSAAEMPVIHDLTHVKFPDYMSPRNLWFMRAMLQRSVARSARVVTVSEAMRTEISSHYDLDPGTISVVPNGIDEREIEKADSAALPSGLPETFLLFVGTLEPRKNLIGALRAHEQAGRDLGSDLPPLVVVGGRGWRDEAITEALGQAPPGSVITTGYVDDRALFGLYRRATALLFPTRYEGFGLPVLEAMASGCPVITSRVGGVPEVAGDAALYIDPDRPDDIARGIRSIVTDPGLRRDLVTKGRSRAQGFTWIKAGEALKAAVEQAVAGT